VTVGEMEWWEDFFDEAYVAAWTAGGWFDGTDEQVEGIHRLLDLPAGSAILDVACGFGRVAWRLQRRGYRVTGLDASEVQLRLAAERHPGPEYVRGDMRSPPAGPFDAVINVFSSFGYFDDPLDDVAALAAWHRVLRPGGVLVMDLMHRDRVAYLHGKPPLLEGAVREEGITDWVEGIRTATVRYRDVVKTFRMRLYTATELVRLLRQAGFSDVEAFGGFQREAVSPQQRLVLRAMK
jgi:SAM-dependent methyltransferase